MGDALTLEKKMQKWAKNLQFGTKMGKKASKGKKEKKRIAVKKNRKMRKMRKKYAHLENHERKAQKNE